MRDGFCVTDFTSLAADVPRRVPTFYRFARTTKCSRPNGSPKGKRSAANYIKIIGKILRPAGGNCFIDISGLRQEFFYYNFSIISAR